VKPVAREWQEACLIDAMFASFDPSAADPVPVLFQITLIRLLGEKT